MAYLRDKHQRGLQSKTVAIGIDPLKALTTGIDNIAVGTSSMDALTTGICNVAIGANALGASTTGCLNIAIGELALGAGALACGDKLPFHRDFVVVVLGPLVGRQPPGPKAPPRPLKRPAAVAVEQPPQSPPFPPTTLVLPACRRRQDRLCEARRQGKRSSRKKSHSISLHIFAFFTPLLMPPAGQPPAGRAAPVRAAGRAKVVYEESPYYFITYICIL